MAGWQKQRGGWGPIIVNIARRGGLTTLCRAPRSWNEREDFRTCCIGAEVDEAAFNAKLEGFRTPRGLTYDTATQVEQTLVDVIRSTSASNATVGPNLLSVILMRPDIRAPSRCRFFPMKGTPGGGPSSWLEGHNPWIVGGGMLYPPGYQIGDWNAVLDGWGRPFGIKGAPSQCKVPLYRGASPLRADRASCHARKSWPST
jgi:hypothetical protein